MPGLYGEINSRADFFAMLDDAIEVTAAMLAHSPSSPVPLSASKQLAAIKQWTANGREPTLDERYRITIGVMAARELDDYSRPDDSPLTRYQHKLSAINNYVEGWPDDAVAANPPADESERLFWQRYKWQKHNGA
jgi:Tsi6